MTLEELQRESFYRQLSEGQKKFVLAICSGEEQKAAAKTAWNCKDDASANAMANRAMKNANAKWLITRFLGKGAASRVPTQEELAAWNWEKAQQDGLDPALAIKFAGNVADIMGYKVRPMDPTIKPPTNDGGESFEL